MDCSLPGSSVHRILQTRMLEWVAMPSSRRSSQPGDWTWVFSIAGRVFTAKGLSAFRILLPGPGLEFGLWQRKWGVLTVGPPEKSQQALLYNSNSSFTSFPQCDCFKCGLFLWDGYPYICSTDLLQGLIVKHVQSSQHGAWPTLDMQYMVKSRQCQFYPPPISCLWFIRLMSAFSIRLKTLRRKRPGLFRYCYIPKVQERCILFRLR